MACNAHSSGVSGTPSSLNFAGSDDDEPANERFTAANVVVGGLLI
jgi:hypothetical protein